jgi:galactonate dehydratase
VKITRIECFPVFNGARNNLFVTVDTDEGIDGVGESGLSGRELAVMGAVEHFKPLLVGQDASRIEHIWQTLFRGGFFPANRVLCSAISAIDIALWDIQGKALGVPVYRLLGGLARAKVVCYPHAQVPGEGDDVAALVENCQRFVQEGWKFVRWGLPQHGDLLEPAAAVRTALAQLAAVRAALGDEVEICLDVHTRLDLSDAVRLCRASEQFRPFFMEDPLRAENPHLYRRLRAQTAVPLAAGEQFASKWEFRELIEEDLIDYCRVDLCIVGGLTEARKIAGWCETHGIKLATHNPLGPVSTAACLHLNLASSNVGVQEQPRQPGTSLLDVLPVQVAWSDGYLLPPTLPGLGVEFDRDAARRHPFEMTEPPHLRRLDGSFTNW